MDYADSLRCNIEDLQELNNLHYDFLKISQVIDLGLKGFDEQERLKNYFTYTNDYSTLDLLFNMSLYSLPYIYGNEDNNEDNNSGRFVRFLKKVWGAILNFLKRLFPWFNKKSDNLKKYAQNVRSEFESFINDDHETYTYAGPVAAHRNAPVSDKELQRDTLTKDAGDALEVDKRITQSSFSSNTAKSDLNADSEQRLNNILKLVPDGIKISSNISEWINKANDIVLEILENKDDIYKVKETVFNDLRNISLTPSQQVNTLTVKMIQDWLDKLISLTKNLSNLSSVIQKYIDTTNTKYNEINKTFWSKFSFKTPNANLIDAHKQEYDLIKERRKSVRVLTHSISSVSYGISHILDDLNRGVIMPIRRASSSIENRINHA